MDIYKQVSVLADDFASCSNILTAIGDETRMHLIIEMRDILPRLNRWGLPLAKQAVGSRSIVLMY